jgi:hypothetical protein
MDVHDVGFEHEAARLPYPDGRAYFTRRAIVTESRQALTTDAVDLDFRQASQRTIQLRGVAFATTGESLPEDPGRNGKDA